MTSKCPVHNLDSPYDEEWFADPYPTYERLHEEGPIHRVCLPDGSPIWLITRYDEASEALKDRRLVRNRRYADSDYTNEMLPEIVRSGNLHMEDGPLHTRLRRFMNFAFTPKRMADLVPRIQQVVGDLLDEIERKGGGDIMSDLAAPLPITMTADILGVPDTSRADFRAWSDAMLGKDPAAARVAAGKLLAFVEELIEFKKKEPADDLISYWISARDNEGQPLTDQEMIGMTFFLLLGGYDTTVGQIGASVLALINNPEKAQEMRDNPDIIPAAVEELMRWDGSTHSGIRRFAIEDMTIGGADIKAGQQVIISLGAANRDPERFECPAEIRLDRPDNQQLGFGRGPHHCPGKELARNELRIALGEVVRRFPNIKCAVPQEELDWRPSWLIRVPRQFPVTV
ncbi:cytochrome P450 family protein [Nucisporomicrobium flavum]|uniref:cytochrome P450 family protein n=1 Tax=Nucisporomicrobium flavum TaxID=2785915 RepID=UPI0018F3965D|nr:cytochrome P450 [Nucisporomicrobium flavum]